MPFFYIWLVLLLVNSLFAHGAWSCNYNCCQFLSTEKTWIGIKKTPKRMAGILLHLLLPFALLCVVSAATRGGQRTSEFDGNWKVTFTGHLISLFCHGLGLRCHIPASHAQKKSRRIPPSAYKNIQTTIYIQLFSGFYKSAGILRLIRSFLGPCITVWVVFFFPFYCP